MTASTNQQLQSPRRLACARCGSEFSCSLSGDCWCGEEAVRLPIPASGTGFDDCLCRSCLRAVAAEAATASAEPNLHDQDRRRKDD